MRVALLASPDGICLEATIMFEQASFPAVALIISSVDLK
jgi:hypothetical protein